MRYTRLFFIAPQDQLPGDRVVTEPGVRFYVTAWFMTAKGDPKLAADWARGCPTAERTVLIARQVKGKNSDDPVPNPDPASIESVIRVIGGANVLEEDVAEFLKAEEPSS